MRLALFSFFIALVVVGCDAKKEVVAVEPAAPRDTVVVIMEPAQPKDSLVITYEQTPCFGRCPVYKVKVYESGFATYEGLNFAEKMGLYSFRFDQTVLEEIFKMADEIDYFNLQTSYDDPRISDLPSIISSVARDGNTHRIKVRRGAPDELVDFHKKVKAMLVNAAWEPYSLR